MPPVEPCASSFNCGLSVKAHGPDGFSVPLLRQLSLEHCEELGRLYRYLEVQGVCPHQWCFSIIIMLPKNQEIERPIGLMCTLHKVPTRLRWGLVEDWIRKSRHLFWYDAAFPGCATLDVSLKRMMQFERARYQDRHRITIFLDLTTFYESIEHEQLISEAKRLGFPATVLLWVMHAYTGPRILSCPEGTAPAIHATRGLIAGCPAAPALSKVALAAPCQRVLAMRTVVGADLWIDDISVDCESSSARLAAKNALLSLLVSRALLQELKGAGHLPSLKKSYFVCGSYACEKELRRLLMPEDIRIHRIGKDLGVPTTCARRRSTAGQKERLQKGMRRSNNLHALKVGPGKARARLFTASVLASGVWGHQGQGLSPSVRGKLRLQAARINKHQKLGSVIAALDMQEFVGDPVEEAVCQHWRSISKILARDPSWVSRTWQVLWSRLGDQRRWARVTGPLGAMVAYLKDYGIEAPEWSHWTSREIILLVFTSIRICPGKPSGQKRPSEARSGKPAIACCHSRPPAVCWKRVLTGLSRGGWSTNTNPDPTASLACERSGRALFCEAPAVAPLFVLSARRRPPPNTC